MGLDRTVLAFLGPQSYHVDAGLIERAQHFFPAGFRQMGGGKTAVPDNQPECRPARK
jgi:hypothetical protein